MDVEKLLHAEVDATNHLVVGMVREARIAGLKEALEIVETRRKTYDRSLLIPAAMAAGVETVAEDLSRRITSLSPASEKEKRAKALSALAEMDADLMDSPTPTQEGK